MNIKLYNVSLLLLSLIGYLEWGNGNNTFLFESELLILSKLFSNPLSVIHPFIIMPMLGQIILIITLFQKTPWKKLSLIGIALISILFLLLFVISFINFNIKVLVSVIPFLAVGFYHANAIIREDVRAKKKSIQSEK